MNRFSFKLIDKIISITPWELDTLKKELSRLIASKTGKQNIDIQNQPNGNYFLKIIQDNKQQTIKL